jgi:hypothetical protein
MQTMNELEEFRTIVDESQNLITFLRAVKPVIEAQLDRNIRSNAFEGYSVSWEDEIHTISCLHELVPSPDFSAAASEVSVTSCSWNSTGSSIAVSHGRFDHSGWCVHPGILSSWSVFRRKMNPSKPDISIETPVRHQL